MRKDTPVNTQLPEWKKEVAEKVRAYGERKKRLTTPPHPLKEKKEHQQVEQIPVKPAVPYVSQPPQRELIKPETSASVKPAEVKQPHIPPAEPAAPLQPDLEVWTQDLEGIASAEFLEPGNEETVASSGPYLTRRLFAGVIDNAMLVIVTIAVLFAFSFFLDASMEWLIVSSWKGTLLLFLLVHFLYYLYFLRASRQTPGMLFVSLEVRDPVITVVPIGKIIVRWFTLILLNVFNVLPALQGKNYLLLDQLSGTEMRSFK